MTDPFTGPLIPGSLPRLTAGQSWEQLLRQVIDQGRSLVQQAEGLSSMSEANDIQELIASTAEGQQLEGTTISREDAALRAQLFADMLTWMDQPVGDVEGAPSRKRVLFKLF